MLRFRIRYSTNTGEIGVNISGVNYTYSIDAGFIPRIRKLARYKPGKALAFLKEVAYDYIKEGGD